MSSRGKKDAGAETVSPLGRLRPRDKRETREAGAEAGVGEGDGDGEPDEATGADTSGMTAKKKNTEQRAVDRLKESLRLGHIKLH